MIDRYIQDIRGAAPDGQIDWDVIDEWSRRVAEKGDAKARYKSGVRRVEPDPAEQAELLKAYASVVAYTTGELYSTWHDYSDKTHVSLGDLLGDSWELFLRLLARHDADRSGLLTWAYVDWPATIRDHLIHRQSHRAMPEDYEPAHSAAVHFDWEKVAARIAEQDERFKEIWGTLNPILT